MELCGRGTSFGLVGKRYDLREKGESVQLSLVVALNKLVRLRFLGTCGCWWHAALLSTPVQASPCALPTKGGC